MCPAAKLDPMNHRMANLGPVVRRDGWCPICAGEVTFASFDVWLRDHYFCPGCGSIPRERALMHAIEEHRPNWRELRIHEGSPCERGASQKLAGECRHYIQSQFDPDLGFGRQHPLKGYRSEDLEKQTFPDESFDLVITQDVMEHIFDVEAAFREIHRTLKPGGLHIFTTPLVNKDKPSLLRASRRDDGSVAHHFPPEFHGNPMSECGSLVVWHWGFDIARRITHAGAGTAQILDLEDERMGIEGEYLEVVIQSKELSRSPSASSPLPDEPCSPSTTVRNWDSIADGGCLPVYGFHEVESGFVWSTHAFGLFFPAACDEAGATIFSVYNPHTEVTLSCLSSGQRFAVIVPPGEQRIAIDCTRAGCFVEFEITPKILIGSDVRDLGLMFRRVGREPAGGQPFLRLTPEISAARSDIGGNPNGLDRLRAAAGTIGTHILGGFLREAWFRANYVHGALQMQLHVPPWNSHSIPSRTRPVDSIACTCLLRGREEPVVFQRDPKQSNLYVAAWPIRRLADRQTDILSLDEPADLNLQPNTLGRFRWQGVHWRGRGADGLPAAGNIQRVAGPVSLENFLLHGAS